MSAPESALQADFINGILQGSQTGNIAAACGVAAGYGLLMLVAVFNYIRERHGSHILLILFGAIRLSAFAIRAYMEKHLSEGLVIAYQVLFAVGFVALVKLCYSLLMAWTLPNAKALSQAAKDRRGGFGLLSGGLLSGLIRSHGALPEQFAFFALIAAVVCNIIGSTDAYGNNPSNYSKGLKLLKAGYTIYLAVIVIFCIFVKLERFVTLNAAGIPMRFHRAYTKMSLMAWALLAIGLLLTVKSVFQVVAIYANPALTFRSHLFYPLEVMPELLVFLILVIPGFIHQYLSYDRKDEQDIYPDPAVPASQAGLHYPNSHPVPNV